MTNTVSTVRDNIRHIAGITPLTAPNSGNGYTWPDIDSALIDDKPFGDTSLVDQEQKARLLALEHQAVQMRDAVKNNSEEAISIAAGAAANIKQLQTAGYPIPQLAPYVVLFTELLQTLQENINATSEVRARMTTVLQQLNLKCAEDTRQSGVDNFTFTLAGAVVGGAMTGASVAVGCRAANLEQKASASQTRIKEIEAKLAERPVQAPAPQPVPQPDASAARLPVRDVEPDLQNPNPSVDSASRDPVLPTRNQPPANVPDTRPPAVTPEPTSPAVAPPSEPINLDDGREELLRQKAAHQAEHETHALHAKKHGHYAAASQQGAQILPGFSNSLGNMLATNHQAQAQMENNNYSNAQGARNIDDNAMEQSKRDRINLVNMLKEVLTRPVALLRLVGGR